jgi:hypothetical protein
VVFCFAKLEDAEASARRFSGDRLPTGGRRKRATREHSSILHARLKAALAGADRDLEFASGHQLDPLSTEQISANMIGRFWITALSGSCAGCFSRRSRLRHRCDSQRPQSVGWANHNRAARSNLALATCESLRPGSRKGVQRVTRNGCCGSSTAALLRYGKELSVKIEAPDIVPSSLIEEKSSFRFVPTISYVSCRKFE